MPFEPSCEHFVLVAAAWPSSVMLISVCRNGPPGMTMVGDMFNSSLKSKLDAVCTELAAYLAHPPCFSMLDRRTRQSSYILFLNRTATPSGQHLFTSPAVRRFFVRILLLPSSNQCATSGMGQFFDFGVVLKDVRFTPDSDRTADIAGGPFCADIVAKVFLG
jgi:hypothetical protein